MTAEQWRLQRWRTARLRAAAGKFVLGLGLLGGLMPTITLMQAQQVPPGKDMGVGYCPKHKRNFKGWICPECEVENKPVPAPAPGASDPDVERRAKEAEAERKRLIDQENAKVAKEEQARKAKFARERDARAKQLRGVPNSGPSQLKGVAGSGSSGLKGGGFDSGSSGLKGLETGGQGTRPHTDPSVVDARVPRDGAYFTSQVPELKNSPAADRIRKGFQAVVNHDWPVALAWWKEALKRDPKNKALQRSVDLAQWMVDRPKVIAKGPANPLSQAIYSASHGDPEGAIRQFEQIKAAQPAYAAGLDSMITALRQSQVKAASDAWLAEYWNERVNSAKQKLVDDCIETGINHLSVGDEVGAQEAFALADWFSEGPPSDRPAIPQPPKSTPKKPIPKGGPAEGNR